MYLTRDEAVAELAGKNCTEANAYLEGVSQSALDRVARARDADAWCWK